MAMEEKKDNTKQLPDSAIQFIEHVIRKIRYRRKVRADVQAELMSHFEDELQECKTDHERLEKTENLITEFGDIKLIATLIRRAKKRGRPLWQKVLIRAGQGVGIIFLYIFICTIPLLIGKPTIKIDYVQWLNEKEQAGRDESENAGVYYEKAASIAEGTPDWIIESLAQWPTDFNDTELKKLSDWLQENKSVVEILRTAVDYSDFWHHYEKSEGLDGVFTDVILPGVMEVLPGYRKAAFTIRENIRYEAWRGDVNQAMNDCYVLTKMGYDIEGRGLLIEQLVGVALEALGIGEYFQVLDKVKVKPEIIENTLEQLKNLYAHEKLVISLDLEKVFWYDILQRNFTDDGNGDGRMLRRGVGYTLTNPLNPLRFLLFDYPGRKEVKTSVEEYFERSSELMSKTPKDLFDEGLSATNWADDTYGSLMLNLQEPAHFRVSQQCWNMIIQRRALLTVLALLQYKEKTGQLPNGLNELVESGYLKEILQDPYSNKPLVYIKDDKDSFKLYSVGRDLIDNGGEMGISPQGEKRRLNTDNGDWIYWPLNEPEK